MNFLKDDIDDIISTGLPAFLEESSSGEFPINRNNKKIMNAISNITFLTLAVGSLGGVVSFLQAHDYPVAIGMLVFGLIMVYVYEKTPPTTPNV